MRARMIIVVLVVGAVAIGVPSAKAEEFSCNTTAATPFDTAIDAVAADVPLVELGQSASCTSDAAIAMSLRPEIRIVDSPAVWAPAGPPTKGTKPGLHREASMQAWYKCSKGLYRTEARVEGGSYFYGAIDTDEDLSGGRSIDCKVKVKVS